MKNRFQRMILLLLCASVLCLSACGAFAEEEQTLNCAVVVKDGLTDDERFEDYVAGLFGLSIPNPVHNRQLANGVTLTGDMLTYYNFLKGCIEEVAAGKRSSTQFTLDMDFTLDSAGSQKLLDALLVDLPYELYWFDKTVGYYINWRNGETIFSFTVNREYAAGEYEVDTTEINRANQAVQKVNSVLSQYSSSSDYGKLKGYKNTICNLVTYNDYAAAHSDRADSNAWQLIWVFDGDTTTNVVCEGYSKAFKYLCDRSSFSGSVSCLLASGDMGDDYGTGAHMWNLVRMPNGKTYMADITNCDSGCVGADDLLFLAGYYSGSITSGYWFRCDYGDGSYEDIYYKYDSHTRSVFSTEELTVASVGYNRQNTREGTIGDGLTWALNEEGTLSITGYGSTGEVSSKPWPSAEVKDIEIGEGVTGIGSSLFSDCANLTDVTIPASVSSIGSNAFPKGTETLFVVCQSYAQTWARENGYKNRAEDPAAPYGYTGTDHQNIATTAAVEATCTEDGRTEGTTCLACGDIVSKSEIVAATGHTFTEHVKVDPFCNLEGTEAYWSCDVCGRLFSDAEGKNEIAAPVTIAALTHIIVYHPTVEPTIISTGTEEYWECTRCGTLFSDSEEKNVLTAPVIIPRLGPEDKVEAFVTRCYYVLLGRNPDPTGLKDWAATLKNGTAAAANVIDGIVNSDEFKLKNLSNEEKVTVLYQAMLGRNPDPAGLAAWAQALADGYPYGTIINGFCQSVEFTNICEEYEIEPGSVDVNTVPAGKRAKIEAYVARCYTVLLGRGVDAVGLKDWSDALEQGTAAASQIIDGIVNSVEYALKNYSAEQSVINLYNAMLDRDPDPAGLAAWTAVLHQGYPFGTVINGFCQSVEFTNICNQYGITPGSVTVKGISEKGVSITPEDSGPNGAARAVRTSEYTNEEKIREFVRHCYRSVLGRDADEEGLKGYTDSILKGIKTPKQVAHEFIFSPEFQSRLPGNEDFIRILYQLYLYRDADAAGLAEWVAQLNAGASLESVADGFAGSAEFKRIIKELK